MGTVHACTGLSDGNYPCTWLSVGNCPCTQLSDGNCPCTQLSDENCACTWLSAENYLCLHPLICDSSANQWTVYKSKSPVIFDERISDFSDLHFTYYIARLSLMEAGHQSCHCGFWCGIWTYQAPTGIAEHNTLFFFESHGHHHHSDLGAPIGSTCDSSLSRFS